MLLVPSCLRLVMTYPTVLCVLRALACARRALPVAPLMKRAEYFCAGDGFIMDKFRPTSVEVGTRRRQRKSSRVRQGRLSCSGQVQRIVKFINLNLLWTCTPLARLETSTCLQLVLLMSCRRD